MTSHQSTRYSRLDKQMYKDRLANSITIVISCFLAFHLAFVSLVAWYFRTPARLTLSFLAIIAGWHVFLAWTLLSRRHLFLLQTTGALLRRVNVCNILTIGRLTALPGILYLLLAPRTGDLAIVILPYIGLFLITDLFDGQLARRLGQVTRIGRYLDATSDYLVLAGIMFVFLWFRFIPVWFFVLVLVRLSLMSAGNAVVFALQGHLEAQTSLLGKASVFAISLFFGAKILATTVFATPGGSGALVTTNRALGILQLIAAAIVALSIVEKSYILVIRIGTALRERRPTSESDHKIQDRIE